VVVGPHRTRVRVSSAHAVLAPNLLGSCYGSTGPAQCPDGFPQLTTRDMARAIGVLLERLGVARLALVTGGSLGGMVALEFVATFPRRADAAVILAAPVAHSAAAIAWTHVQREALRLAGTAGLRLARQVAMLSYRTPHGLHHRFRRFPGARGAFAVQDWLDAHGERLDARFDGASYLALLDAMDTHDLARGRGGAGERLRGSGTRLTAVGIPGDQLYPAEEVKAWAGEAGARYVELRSLHGHDAFLIEREQVAGILRDALRSPGSDAREVA
jgi:homoserine O-acetyltransferase/O-succinyltransferase